MVIFGLTEYIKASHELGANFHADITVNGKTVMSRQFVAADALNPVQPAIHLDTSQLSWGANTIHIHKSGEGRLYWSASGTYYSKDKRLVQSNKLSLNITRDYFRLTPEQWWEIIYNLTPLQGTVQVAISCGARHRRRQRMALLLMEIRFLLAGIHHQGQCIRTKGGAGVVAVVVRSPRIPR